MACVLAWQLLCSLGPPATQFALASAQQMATISGKRLPLSPSLFEGKVALVTGGGSGIGREVVRHLLLCGAKGVAFCVFAMWLMCSHHSGRTMEKLQATATLLKDITQSDDTLYYDVCDIRSEHSVNAFVDRAIQSVGNIDVLVNNAGGQFPARAENISPKGFTAVVKNNLLATYNVIHAVAHKCFLPVGNTVRGGSIVTVTAQTWNGFPGMAHTGAARAGLDNLTKTLALEWAPYKIRVNSIAPGVILTSGAEANYSDGFFPSSLNATPLNRFGTPEEIAHLILVLSSDDLSGFVTGSTLYADGGQRLHGHYMNASWVGPARL